MKQKPRKLKMSASAVGDFKACPMRYFGKYIQGLRRIEDTEAQRTGTNWHSIQDIITRKPGSVCVPCGNLAAPDPECTLCAGSGFLPDDLMIPVVRELNAAYGKFPDSMDRAKLERERIVLLYGLSGYNWRWGDEPIEVLARELKTSLPLINPTTGRALPYVQSDGIIDKLIRYNGRPAIIEHKTTGSSLDSDSNFWAHLMLDVQTTFYIYAAQKMQLAGELVDYGIKPNDELINTVLYDVFHKPGIGFKNLTQGESKKFVVNGGYCGQTFEVLDNIDTDGDPGGLYVNSLPVEVTPGAKEGTFAVRETPEMFGARLLQDITQRPDFYFARKELSKTDQQMKQFEKEWLCIYRTIRSMLKMDSFYCNEKQCEATFKCDFISECYTGKKLDGENPPDGFKSIFKKGKKDAD